jgi:hypothetical protein
VPVPRAKQKLLGPAGEQDWLLSAKEEICPKKQDFRAILANFFFILPFEDFFFQQNSIFLKS